MNITYISTKTYEFIELKAFASYQCDSSFGICKIFTARTEHVLHVYIQRPMTKYIQLNAINHKDYVTKPR